MKYVYRAWLTALVSALLLAAPLSSAQNQQAPTLVQSESLEGEEFTLNLKEADITTLVATVSEVTGRNFVVDPRVKGQVTVLSTQSMSPAELYETFLSVLEVHGFSAVPAGEVTKIVPQVNAKQDGGFGRDTTTREDIITRVLQVDNVPADQLVPILRPLVPQYGHLAAYPASNILIISDRAANVERMAEIVSRIDKKGDREIERVQLENASATEIVRVINELKQDAEKRSPSTSDFSAIPDERTNSVLITGDRQARMRLRAIIAELDTEVEQQGGTQVIYLKYADAESISTALQSFAETAANQQQGGGQAGSGTRRAEPVRVIAEPGANALVVTAPADIMQEIRSVINQLDIRRGQVLVEAIIAEVTIDRSRQLGVDVAVFNEDGPAAASILDSSTLQAIPSLAMDGTPLGLIQQGINLAAGQFNEEGTSFAVLLKALSGDTHTNVLSTPSLLTRDNEEAEITVAQEVPFITGSFTNTGTGGGGGQVNPFQTVERRDVGLILGITPQINAGNTIQLTISQEISSIAQGTGQTGAVDLITNERTINTSVEVEDGQILVLGGLIDDNVQESEQKVPILGDIPLIGELFTFRNVTKRKRNLLNFIRPTILRGQGAANYYTRQKYDYLRGLQQEQRQSRIPLLPGEERPQLPPMEKYSARPEFPEDARLIPKQQENQSPTQPPSKRPEARFQTPDQSSKAEQPTSQSMHTPEGYRVQGPSKRPTE